MNTTRVRLCGGPADGKMQEVLDGLAVRTIVVPVATAVPSEWGVSDDPRQRYVEAHYTQRPGQPQVFDFIGCVQR